MTRFSKIALVIAAVLSCSAVASFSPLVRHQANLVAARYGASISIQAVSPRWLGVTLHDVDVQLHDVPSATIQFHEVDVDLGFSGKRVILRDGTVSAVGPRETVLRQAETWRAHQLAKTTASAPEGNGRGTEVAGLKLLWKNRTDEPTESVSATGVNFSRVQGNTSIRADDATVSLGSATVSLKDGHVVLAQSSTGYKLDHLVASSVDALVVLPESTSPIRVPMGQQPISTKVNAKGVNHGIELRQLLVAMAQAIDVSLADGAKVDLGGVSARVRQGDDKLNLGPGNLVVQRQAGTLIVELSPSQAVLAQAGNEQNALTFRLSVPLSDSPDTPKEILADLRGGPIWLSTLGVHDGDMGLFDVTKTSLVSQAHVVLSGDGETLTLDGEGKIRNLSIRNQALSDQPVAGLDLAWRGKAQVKLDGSRISVQEGEIDLGSIRMIAHGEYQKGGDSMRVRGKFEMPLTPCQSMLDSTPKGLVPKLEGMKLAGSFGLKGSTRFDTAKLDRDFQLDWDTSNTCRIVEVPPEIHVNRFKKAFHRVAYGPQGQPIDVESGPGTPSWVAYASISKFMEVAVLTTEDGGFYRHHGFDTEAIRNSIRENLRKQRFVRGASTISMQLAKNLYLERNKTVARKLQEAVLTMYLEQELTKEQMMELYLNVIEVGPLIYGVGAAARHYFNTSAAQLSLGQALYISSILPNPKVQHFLPSGAVTPGWTKYLRKLMQIAADRQRITDEELEQAMLETVVRGLPVPHREPRNSPVDEQADTGDEMDMPPDEAWQNR